MDSVDWECFGGRFGYIVKVFSDVLYRVISFVIIDFLRGW